MRMGIIVAGVAALAAASPSAASAGVRLEEKSEWQLEGMLGKVASLVTRRKPEAETTTVAATASRKVSMSATSGEIVDLDAGEVYQLDLENRTYTVTTFDELRRRVEASRREAASTAGAERQDAATGAEPRTAERNEPAPDELLKRLEIDVTVESTGRTRTFNGFDTREVVMRITAHEKGRTLDESGGLALTSSMWLTPRIPALRELEAFDRRYARKLAGAIFAGAQEEGPAASPSAASAHPMLGGVLVRMRSERANVEGYPVLTTTTVDLIPSAEQRAEQQRAAAAPPQRSRSTGKGVGGLLGGIVSRAVEKKIEQPRERPEGDAQQVTIFRMTHEVLRVSTDVRAADLALPAGFTRVR